MIKVSYLVRDNDRLGYTEEHEKRFNNMSDVFEFIKRVGLHRRVEGRMIIGTPVVEDVARG